MTYGTCYFITLAAAASYYRSYGDDLASVRRKVAEKLIHIGRPPLKSGEKAVLDADGRYFVKR